MYMNSHLNMRALLRWTIPPLITTLVHIAIPSTLPVADVGRYDDDRGALRVLEQSIQDCGDLRQLLAVLRDHRHLQCAAGRHHRAEHRAGLLLASQAVLAGSAYRWESEGMDVMLVVAVYRNTFNSFIYYLSSSDLSYFIYFLKRNFSEVPYHFLI